MNIWLAVMFLTVGVIVGLISGYAWATASALEGIKQVLEGYDVYKKEPS